MQRNELVNLTNTWSFCVFEDKLTKYYQFDYLFLSVCTCSTWNLSFFLTLEDLEMKTFTYYVSYHFNMTAGYKSEVTVMTD